MPSKASTGVLVVMLASAGASTFSCSDRQGLGSQPAGAAGTTGVAGTGEPIGGTGAAGTTSVAGTTGAAGTSSYAGTTGAAGTTGYAGTNGTAATSGYAGAIGAAGAVMLAPLSGDWSKVEATPGCGHPAGLPLGVYVRSLIQTMGTKPAGCADSRCGAWSYEREYYVRFPPAYDGNKPYPVVFEGPGCGGKGNNLYDNPTLGTLAIRVGLTPPPNDIGHATNPNQSCFDDREGDDSVDWVFYENVYDTLASQFCFDRNRVFVGGNSSGARMANELGCKYAGDVLRPIRGVMPRAAGFPPDPKHVPTCTSKPLAGIWVWGVPDATNPSTEIVATINRAISVSGCPAGTTYANAQYDPFPLAGDTNSCKRLKGCPADVPLVVCPLPVNTSHGSSDNVVNPGWVTFLKLFIPPALIKRAVFAVALVGVGALIVAAFIRGGVAAADVATRTIDSTGSGLKYWRQCQSNDVPSPRPWGRSTIGDGVGQWKARGTLDDSYITALPVDVYTMTSTTPPGICAIAIRADATFDVLCQGTNGKTCFWEADAEFWPKHGFRTPPPQFPKDGDIAIVGLVPAAPDQGVQCTQCHVGENAFITHTRPGHPTNQRTLAGWMPSTIYAPIVPKDWPRNGGALSTSDYPRSCLSGCHDLGSPSGAGRLPRLRGLDPLFCDILKKVTSLPASRGGMPPTARDCTPSVDCPLDVDVEVKAMVANCGAPGS